MAADYVPPRLGNALGDRKLVVTPVEPPLPPIQQLEFSELRMYVSSTLFRAVPWRKVTVHTYHMRQGLPCVSPPSETALLLTNVVLP